MNEFDEKAKKWDLQHRVTRAKCIADEIKKALPADPSLTAVEYGCGTGLLGFFLRDSFSFLTFVDNSKGMLEVVREKISHEGATNMEALDTDEFSAKVTDGKRFNVFFSLMTLHHIADTKQALLEWHNALASGGYLAIVDLDAESGLFHDEGFDGHNGFDRSELGKMLIEVGFKNVGFKTAYTIEKVTRDGANHTFPLFLMTARKM